MSTRKSFAACLLLGLLFCHRPVEGLSRGMTARAIVGKMAAQYANAPSYQDAGVVLDVKGEAGDRGEAAVKFKTAFARPNLFRFDWTQPWPGSMEGVTSAVWSEGGPTFSYYGWEKVVKEYKDIGLGVAGATGVSLSSAHTVATLLMEEVGGFRLSKMTDLSLLGEERFEGEDCYVVRGYHPQKFPIDTWVSKRDFLLRKIKSRKLGGGYVEEIRRDVRLGGSIDRESLTFTPPKAVAEP